MSASSLTYAAITSLLCSVAYGGFISASGLKLYDTSTCLEFLPVGFNTWVDLAQSATSIASTLSPSSTLTGQQDKVTSLFAAAKELNLNAMRLFGHGDGNFQLQTAPGVYNEAAWRGFDYILAQAALFDIRVIWVAINNWLDADVGDGKLAYCRWAGIPDVPTSSHSGAAEDLFWEDARARQLVKDHFRVLTSRRNYFTGVQYKDDPTIFAYNLFNEPRCPASNIGPECSSRVTSWYNDLAAYVRQLDSNHLVTTGEEGFFGMNSGQRDANPISAPGNPLSTFYWAANNGQDFRSQHASPDIGLAVAHLWPDNWQVLSSSFPPRWIGNHSLTAKALQKPFVLEEFGKKAINGLWDRTEVFDQTYDALLDSLKTGGALRGVLFWRWNNDQGGGGSEDELTTIYNGDETYRLIQGRTQELKDYIASDYNLRLPSCTPSSAASAPHQADVLPTAGR